VVTGLLLLLAAAFTYQKLWHAGFIWDDDAHLTRPDLRPLQGLWRIWSVPGTTQQYYPVLYSAFWLEHRLWGDSALGYHLFNVGLHAAAAYLLLRCLRALGIPGALLGAAAFTLHPVCAESVAWISEQKNTLSAVFYLAAGLSYIRFDRERRLGWYALGTALFVMALLSKSVSSTLPAALLLALWWKRGRLRWRDDILPLVPWLALGAGAGAVTAWMERTFVGATGAAYDFGIAERVLIAGRALWFYLGKIFWPFGLTFIYPRWSIDSRNAIQYAFPAAALAAILVLWAIRARTRGPLAAALLFSGTLFPALGFINIFPFVYSYVADHFQYMAAAFMMSATAAGFALVVDPLSLRIQWAARFCALLVLVALASLTWRQCAMYVDAETLWRTTIARNPACWMAYNNLGLILAEKPERLTEAIADYREAIRLKPDFAKAHTNLGNALAEVPGRLDDAIAEQDEALRLEPNYAEAHNNLGLALSKMPGRLSDAVTQYVEALRIDPGDAEAHNNLGNALSQMPGRLDDAVAQYEEVLRLEPDDASAHDNLAGALSRIPGRLNDAAAQCEEALRLRPDFAEAHNNLGGILSQIPGRLDDAVSQYNWALRLKPDFMEAHYNLALAYSKSPGHLSDAASQFEAALRLRPGFAEARYNLGNVLFQTPGQVENAIAQFEGAVSLRPDYFEAHTNLGVALCLVGKTQEGLEHIETAIRLRPNYAKAHLARGSALLQAGRRQDAVSEFQEVLRLRPGDPSAIRMLELARTSR
jgi:tetratricopeptide (TPR) repeat protein